jgi:hypothetical protein
VVENSACDLRRVLLSVYGKKAFENHNT